MSINIGIVDQQATKLATDLAPEYEARLNIKKDPTKQRSLSFVFLVVKWLLDLPEDDALDCLTEGGNDLGIDAVHVGDVEDNEFVVTLFQGKYTNNANGTNAFQENAIGKAISAIKCLFDPASEVTVNDALRQRLEDIRSLIADGKIPRIRAVMCSNGCRWNQVAQERIDREQFPSEQVRWDYINHDHLVGLMQATKPVTDTLRLTGKAIVEDFDYCRVLVGKIPVREIEALFNRHGDLLLDRNIRRFLGLQGNRVNQQIATTLRSQDERSKFYFFNNGITLLCDKFAYNALQAGNYQVNAEGLQIINGGQTCKTIQSTLSQMIGDVPDIEKAFVLVRLYELPEDSDDLVRSITYATNSQNPVDLRDLKSNDALQKSLEADVLGLGYSYLRNRSDAARARTQIRSTRAAEAVLAVWREKPHQARSQNREFFGNLYDTIFTDSLNGAQVILAVLLFRFAEKKRQRPPEGTPAFISYASHFVAMLMGRYLLADLNIALDGLNHQKFPDAVKEWELKDEQYHRKAIDDLQTAINLLYANPEESLQQLAATFRRGDLLGRLPA